MGSEVKGTFWVTTSMSFKHFPLLAACGFVLLLTVTAQGKPSTAPPGADTGRIAASFSGLQGRSGYLRVSLFNAGSFPDGVPLARQDISLPALGMKASPPTITFAGLRPGAYAVCAFHDRDGSGKLTQNFLGIPLEEWGMSGNPRPRYRSPRFDEAKISLNAREEKTISLRLHI